MSRVVGKARIQAALDEVQASEFGHLSLATRGELWSELGPSTETRSAGETTEDLAPGHRARLRLLQAMASDVIASAWKAEELRWSRELAPTLGPLCRPEDSPPAIIELALSPERTSSQIEARAFRYGTFRQYYYEIWPDAPRAVLCMEFAAGVLDARARDLRVTPDDYEDGNDRWMPDVYACWAYAGSTHLYRENRAVRSEEVAARRNFWRWYLLDALPRALDGAPIEAVLLPPRDWAPR